MYIKVHLKVGLFLVTVPTFPSIIQIFTYLNGADSNDPRLPEVLAGGVEGVPGNLEVAPLGVSFDIARDLDGTVELICNIKSNIAGYVKNTTE